MHDWAQRALGYNKATRISRLPCASGPGVCVCVSASSPMSESEGGSWITMQMGQRPLAGRQVCPINLEEIRVTGRFAGCLLACSSRWPGLEGT
jgi:hypothetical protein